MWQAERSVGARHARRCPQGGGGVARTTPKLGCCAEGRVPQSRCAPPPTDTRPHTAHRGRGWTGEPGRRRAPRPPAAAAAPAEEGAGGGGAGGARGRGNSSAQRWRRRSEPCSTHHPPPPRTQAARAHLVRAKGLRLQRHHPCGLHLRQVGLKLGARCRRRPRCCCSCCCSWRAHRLPPRGGWSCGGGGGAWRPAAACAGAGWAVVREREGRAGRVVQGGHQLGAGPSHAAQAQVHALHGKGSVRGRGSGALSCVCASAGTTASAAPQQPNHWPAAWRPGLQAPGHSGCAAALCRPPPRARCRCRA